MQCAYTYRCTDITDVKISYYMTIELGPVLVTDVPNAGPENEDTSKLLVVSWPFHSD